VALESVIGPGVELEGTWRTTGNLDIHGGFSGTLIVEGLVWLRPGSRVSGELMATDLVVEGTLLSSVRATGKIDLRATCRVEAEIEAAQIVAAEGSQVEGRITVTGGSDEVVAYSERRQP
jgi:cytoskeletal protein CcmA (bactofilin family)